MRRKKDSDHFYDSAVAITLTDKDERIVAWNPFAANLLGMTDADLLNKPVKEFIREERMEEYPGRKIFRKLGRHHLETKIVNKNQRADRGLIFRSASSRMPRGPLPTDPSGFMRTSVSANRLSRVRKYRETLEEFVDKAPRNCRPRTRPLRHENIEREKVEEALRKAYEELKKTQKQLIQVEKMQVAGGWHRACPRSQKSFADYPAGGGHLETEDRLRGPRTCFWSGPYRIRH